MAVINDPNASANISGVGNVIYSPLHTTSGPFPIGSGGAYRLSMQSGLMAVSLGANAEIFQFRYVTSSSRVCLVHGIWMSAGPLVAATAASLQCFRATIARSWSGIGSGGTRATLTTNNAKLRTSHATSEVSDIGISSTTGLTAGTKTFDAQDFGSISYAIGTGAITTGVSLIWVPKVSLFDSGNLGFPIILADQEGFAIRNHSANAHPAGSTWTFSVDVLWTECDSF